VLKQTGPAQMPTVLFAGDVNVEKGRLFTAEALRGGAWLHPQHNMFLSSAHTEADIDKALQATDSAMAVVKKSFGRD
jgi:glutamate-1-semialdehyde 2,1-aminomutase